MQYQAGDLTFTFVDRDTAKTARYWSQRIMRSTSEPAITVQDVTTPASPLPLFTGWIERNQLGWDGEVKTHFTAVTQLSRMDRLDCYDAFGTVSAQGATGQRVPGHVRQWQVLTWASGYGDFHQAGAVPGDLLEINDGGGWVGYTVEYVESASIITVTTDIAEATGQCRLRHYPLTTYSGPVAPLARRLLRVAGNISPVAGTSYPDVRVDDFDHGEEQTDTDWNHVLRTWAEVGANPTTDNLLSETVPSVSGDRLGFVVVHGKLYRVDSAIPSGETRKIGVRLTQITTVPEDQAAAVADGYRLFRFKDALANECLCVVQVETRKEYTQQVEDTPWSNPFVEAGGALATFGAGLLSNKATLPAITLLNWAAGFLPKSSRKVTVSTTGNEMRTVKTIHVLSIGDGTNDPATGVGAAVNKEVYNAEDEQTQFAYVPADAVTVVYNLSSEGSRVYYARFNQIDDTSALWAYGIDAGGGVVGGLANAKPINGRVTGGMVGQPLSANVIVLVVAETNNGLEIRTDGQQVGGVVKMEASGSRFAGIIDVSTGGVSKAAVLYGGDVAYYWRIQISGNTVSATRVDLAGTLPDGFKLVSVAGDTITGPTDTVIEGQVGRACLYKATGAKNQEYVYAGWLYNDAGVVTFQDSAVCQYPIPGARESDIRPPMLFKPTGGSTCRFLVMQAAIDGTRLVCDTMMTAHHAVAFRHHDFYEERISVRQELTGLAQSTGCYLRLMGLAKPTSTGGVKVATRHSFTLTNIGTAGLNQVQARPQVAGTEYYLGATANCYGEEVNVGATGVPATRFVYNLSGCCLTPALARALGAWVVDRYPERSTDYPDGRRWLQFNLRALDNTGEFTPDYDDIYQALTFGAFRNADITALLFGLGFDRRTLLYGSSALEYAASDVTWVDNAGNTTPDALVFVEADALEDPPSPGTASKLLVPWHVHHRLTNMWVSNPENGPCAWARTLWLPHGGTLTGYAVKLLEDGLPEHGRIAIAVWSLSQNRPAVLIDGTKALFAPDGLTAGLNYVSLYDGDVPSYVLEPGLYALVAAIDRQDFIDTSTPEYTAPPIVWCDLMVVGTDQAYAMPMGEIELDWPDTWDSEAEAVTQYAPDIQPVLEV